MGRTASQLLSVIDYHGEAAPETNISTADPNANTGRHRALGALPVPEEWNRWTKISGARVAEPHDTNRIRMHGIASGSTAGLHGAFSNWISAAEKRIGG